MENNNIAEVTEAVKNAEVAYRRGTPIMSDTSFDMLKDTLRKIDPDSPILNAIMGESFLGKKVPLPHPMGSLLNIKNAEDVDKWYKMLITVCRKDIDFVVMPKLDGISATRKANGMYISRGDGGTEGTDITRYCMYFDNPSRKPVEDCRGEIVISRKNFATLNLMRQSAGLDPYKSERSAVIGLMQSDSPNVEHLRLLEFIPYTLYSEIKRSKRHQVETLSTYFNNAVLWHALNGEDIMYHPFLEILFNRWSVDYEIDGLVIEIDDWSDRNTLGFETNSFDPKYARAYKVGFEEQKATTVVKIIQQVGKGGNYTPVIEIDPIVLCGNDITRTNGDNERFLMYYGIGVGSEVTMKKSGNVIPRLTKVGNVDILPFKEFNRLIDKEKLTPQQFQERFGIVDDHYITPNVDHVWDENRVNIKVPTGTSNTTQQIRKIQFFFSHLDILNVGESLITTLFENGYDTVVKILLATDEQLLSLPNFGKKKLDNFKSEISKKLGRASLEAIMQSSGLFDKVGESKLKLLQLTPDPDSRYYDYNKMLELNGMGSITASTIFDNLPEFWKFYDNIKHRIPKTEKTDGILSGQIICFTGFRDKLLVEQIIENGGEYKESISKAITLLIHEDSATDTTKVKKAVKDGTKTMGVTEFRRMFKPSEPERSEPTFGGLL